MQLNRLFAYLRLLCLAALLAGALPAHAQSTCQSRAFNGHEEQVSAAYIAYYGRPADTGGLAYWAGKLAKEGGNLDAIIDAFGNSAEYRQRFGGLSNRELIRNLYQQLYGRDPDAGGWAFYEMWLDTKVLSLASIAISIMDGTEGDDVAILNNRKSVARHFITRMESLGAAAPQITDGGLLANLMAAINASAASRENACAQVNALIDAQAGTIPVLTMSAHEAGASGAISNLSGAVNSERYFKLTVPAGVTNLVIRTFHTAGGMGDVDLYVSRGVRPVPGSADCSSTAWFSADEQCSFATPVAGEYFILLRGQIVDYSGVTLSASWRGSAPPPEIEVLTGYFRDSAVKGLDYASCPVPMNPAACLTGQTGADGDYQYRDGDQVRFTLGPLVVAQAPAAPLHTPTTVTRSQDEATKLAQFLQSIDENADPKDGINISPETRARAQNSALVQQGQTDFSLNLNRIPTMVSVLTPGRAVVGPTEALAHAETSQRLLAISMTDEGKAILGRKTYPSLWNTADLASSAKHRLYLYLWQEHRAKSLQVKADNFSTTLSSIERAKNQREALIGTIKSFTTFAIARESKLPQFDEDMFELTTASLNQSMEFVNNIVKSEGGNLDNYNQIGQGTINLMAGKWTGATKNGAQLGINAFFDSETAKNFLGDVGSNAVKVVAETVAIDVILETLVPIIEDCKREFNNGARGCTASRLSLYVNQTAKVANALNNLYAAWRLHSDHTKPLRTLTCAKEYLDNYYQQAGDMRKIAQIYGIHESYAISGDFRPVDAGEKKCGGLGAIDRVLFNIVVAEEMAAMDTLYAIHSQIFGASNMDVYANLHGASEVVCNGTQDTLRLEFLTQHPWFQGRVPLNIDNRFNTERIDWNWSEGVSLTALPGGRSAKVTFDEPGYRPVVASAYGRYNDARTVAIGMRPVRVKSCVVPNEDIVGGRWEFAGFNTTGTGVNYRAVANPGYQFVNWVDSYGNTVSAVAAKYFDVAATSDSDVARPVFRQIAATLGKPSLSVAQEGNGFVKMSWTAVQGAQAYELFVATTPNINPSNPASYIKKSTYNYAGLVVSLDGLVNGQTYYFATRAVADSLMSELSNMVHATPKAGDPVVLNLNLQATSGNGFVDLSWNAIPGATHYMLHMASGVTGPDGLPSIGTTTSTQYRVNGLQNGTMYRFTARAFKGNEVIVGSALVSATPVGNSLIAGRYEIIGDGSVVRDHVNRLEWKRCLEGHTWSVAGQRCDGVAQSYNWDAAIQLTAAGGFRIPNIEELKTLVYCSSGQPKQFGPLDACSGSYSRPTIVEAAFPKTTPSSYVWSGSPGTGNSSFALVVNFDYGSAGYIARNGGVRVRLVRAGQSSALLSTPIPAPQSVASTLATVPSVPPASLAAALAKVTGVGGTAPDAPLHAARLDAAAHAAFFLSRATNLLPGAQGGVQHLYGLDVASGALWRLSQAPSGEAADADTTAFDLAAQAGKLVFSTRATNLESGPGLYLLDLESGVRQPLRTAAQHGGSDPGAENPALGTTGQGLAFDAPDAQGQRQVFTAGLDAAGLYDLHQETPLDAAAATACCAALSADGRYLAWQETGHDGRVQARVLDWASGAAATLDWPQGAAAAQALRLALSADGAQLHWLAAPVAAEDAAPLHGADNPLFVPAGPLH